MGVGLDNKNRGRQKKVFYSPFFRRGGATEVAPVFFCVAVSLVARGKRRHLSRSFSVGFLSKPDLPSERDLLVERGLALTFELDQSCFL